MVLVTSNLAFTFFSATNCLHLLNYLHIHSQRCKFIIDFCLLESVLDLVRSCEQVFVDQGKISATRFHGQVSPVQSLLLNL